MRRRLRYLTFFMIFLFLSWVWVKAFHGNKESMEYIVGNGIETTSVLSLLPSKIIRAWRFVRDSRCWNPNPDDPWGEILKGVDCPRRLKILDKNNPIRKGVGVLIRKHRASDGDLVFDVLPNEEYRYLINESNIKRRKGSLHCEIVPDDRIKFEDIFNRMELNSVVEVDGVWVEDTNQYNWRELHPVTSLRVVREREQRLKRNSRNSP